MDNGKIRANRDELVFVVSTTKRIESVKRHQKWQSELDKNKFLDDLFGSK